MREWHELNVFNPLPEGEGARRAGEGYTATNAEFISFTPYAPHPSLCRPKDASSTTFSLGEKDNMSRVLV